MSKEAENVWGSEERVRSLQVLVALAGSCVHPTDRFYELLDPALSVLAPVLHDASGKMGQDEVANLVTTIRAHHSLPTTVSGVALEEAATQMRGQPETCQCFVHRTAADAAL